MKTIEQYKAAAIYFPPGRIVPNWIWRITKGDKRMKHKMKFGSPVWVLPCGDRNVIFGYTRAPGSHLIIVRGVKDTAFDNTNGMHNYLVVLQGAFLPAASIHKAITEKIGSFTLFNSIKIKGTKLQRRRAKFAAKRAAQAAQGGEHER